MSTTEPLGRPRHVLVTGAAGGIGAAICAAFAADGCAVTAADLREDQLFVLARELRREHGVVAGVLAADLSDAEAAAGLVARAAAGSAGEPEVLVNAAGIYPATPLPEMTAELWDRVMDINVRAAMLTSTAFADLRIAAGRPGAIVNISSGAALRARPGAAHYCASKAALEMLTRGCAIEYGPYGIRVNAVSPGFVTVDSAVNPISPEYAAAVSVNPLGRAGEPADIAAAVRWLAGPESLWTTGAVLRVDGGSSAGTTALPTHWRGPSEIQAGRAADPNERQAAR